MSLKPRTIWKFFAHIMHAHFPLIKIDRLIFCNSLIFLALKSFLFFILWCWCSWNSCWRKAQETALLRGFEISFSKSYNRKHRIQKRLCDYEPESGESKKFISRLFCQLDTEKGTCCRMTAMEVYEASGWLIVRISWSIQHCNYKLH